MPKKKHVTKEEFASKSFYKDFTNRIMIKYSYFPSKKVKQYLSESGLDYKIRNGFELKSIYYKNDDHDKIMDILNTKVKVKSIESITRPYNAKAMTETLGDKHLVIKRSLPFKKYRYKVLFNLSSNYDWMNVKPTKTPINWETLTTQAALGTVKISWNLDRAIKENRTYHWSENSAYVEDEATTSMISLVYSELIDKIYIYKTYDEMKNEQ